MGEGRGASWPVGRLGRRRARRGRGTVAAGPGPAGCQPAWSCRWLGMNVTRIQGNSENLKSESDSISLARCVTPVAGPLDI
jgi:hypothetical protein